MKYYWQFKNGKLSAAFECFDAAMLALGELKVYYAWDRQLGATVLYEA